MSDLIQSIHAQLTATPIRTLSDRALARELAGLRGIRAQLIPPASTPAAPPAAPMPRIVGFQRVPLGKGSIYSRRVPVLEVTPALAVRPAVAPIVTRATRAAALETAAAAAGIPADLWARFKLRLSLLEAAHVARSRAMRPPRGAPG